MSLLTDPEFLLQSLRLSYLRQVLPSHSNLALAPGTGPYNLISFPEPDQYQSPYIALSGLNDSEQWPELASGRHSPPLGGREGRRRGAATESGAGATGLKYSQTIGKVGSGAGMRVDGRARSYKGKGSQLTTGRLETSMGEESSHEEPQGASPSISRRHSLERSLHQKRLNPDSSNLALPPLGPQNIPPPVIIHSPVRTPHDSPVRPGSISLPPTATPSPDSEAQPSHRLHEPSVLEQKDAEDVGQVDLADPAAADVGEDLAERDHLYDGSRAAVASSSLVETDGEASPFELHSPPLSADASEQYSSVPFSPHLASSIEGGLQSPDIGSEMVDDGIVPESVGSRQPDESVASSGVSLFGVSRIPNSATSDQPLAGGAAIRRSRSDSSSSSFNPRPSIIPEESSDSSSSEDDLPPKRVIEPPTQQMLLAFPGLKNLRPQMRERRRVNIKLGQGGMLGAIKEPAHGEDDDSASVRSGLSSTKGKEVSRRPSIEGITAGGEGPEEKGAPVSTLDPIEEKDKTSLQPPPTINTNLASEVPTPATSTPADSGPPKSPRRHHHHHHHHPITFAPRSTFLNKPPPPPTKSLLSAMLSESSSPGSQNPFATLYSALMSRPNSNEPSMSLTIYFPHSKTPTKKLKVSVKKDITVEEVIGCGLFGYWENEWEPKLDLGEKGEDTEPEELTLAWNLRIVEDEGEVDEDFPALDRSRGISAFSFDEFAIVKATTAQVKDNQTKQAQIQRRPSRVLAAPKRNRTPTSPLPVPATAQLGPPQPSFNAVSLPQAGTMGASSSLAVPVLLKVQLPPAPGVELNTTINVPSDMYMSDVLTHICKKRGLENPKDWALVVHHNDVDIIVPLDRTVDSLGENHTLTLVKRSQVSGLANQAPHRPGALKNTNPSASIFKRLSEPPQPRYQSSSSALASAYQTYAVQRKLPMPLGRHPRVIAIDDDYIHFMPSDNKAMFDGGRTSSFHISNVHDCKVSRRAPASFKILVQKDRVEKRYDFEAENPKVAATIVAHIRTLMSNYETEQQLRAAR